MKKLLTHVLTTLALIMAFGLTAYAGHDQFVQHDESAATNAAATQPAGGHPDFRRDGHLD